VALPSSRVSASAPATAAAAAVQEARTSHVVEGLEVNDRPPEGDLGRHLWRGGGEKAAVGRRQQRGKDRLSVVDTFGIVADQPLQKLHTVGTADGDDRAGWVDLEISLVCHVAMRLF